VTKDTVRYGLYDIHPRGTARVVATEHDGLRGASASITLHAGDATLTNFAWCDSFDTEAAAIVFAVNGATQWLDSLYQCSESSFALGIPRRRPTVCTLPLSRS